MAAIFLGRDPAYDATPWNTSNRLGMYFTVLLPTETKHFDDPGAALFMWLANQLVQGAAAIERDATVEHHVKIRLDITIRDLIARLLH